MFLIIEPGSVKYKFAGLTTNPTVKLSWKSQTRFKMLYNTSLNSPSPQILGFQNTGIWHLFKNSNSVHRRDHAGEYSPFSAPTHTTIERRFSSGSFEL
jgi:hypothetical protein